MRVFLPLLMISVITVFSPVRADGEESVSDEEVAPGFFTKTLWYLPNRVLDLLDIVRLRAAVGPGLEAGVRITDVSSLYAGKSRAVWLGLPGERTPGGLPHVAGVTQKRGLVLFGVDATDLTPYPPRYEFSEIGVQLHLGVAGVEAGIVPNAMVDFLFGLIGKDWSGDDLPRSGPAKPAKPGRVLSYDHDNREFPLYPRPDEFDGTSERLDYLYENLPIRMRGYMHSLDRSLVDEEAYVIEQPPVTELEFGIWAEYISEPSATTDFDQRFRLDVEFPNVERNLSLFVDTDYNDDLPGTDVRDAENRNFVLGFRRQLEKMNISGDVGVKARWPPELFARLRWRPQWNWGETTMNFEQRLFWENEDGFGVLSTFQAYRWVGDSHEWIFRNLTAGRFSESTDGAEWQQTLSFDHMTRLVNEHHRSQDIGTNDALQCLSFRASVFGNDRIHNKYRSTVLYRHPLYKEFVILEVEPGLEWRKEYDWTTQYRVDVGMVLLF
jgi:hypothetical protein